MHQLRRYVSQFISWHTLTIIISPNEVFGDITLTRPAVDTDTFVTRNENQMMLFSTSFVHIVSAKQLGEINYETRPCVGSNHQPSDQKSSTLPICYCARHTLNSNSIGTTCGARNAHSFRNTWFHGLRLELIFLLNSLNLYVDKYMWGGEFVNDYIHSKGCSLRHFVFPIFKMKIIPTLQVRKHYPSYTSTRHFWVLFTFRQITRPEVRWFDIISSSRLCRRLFADNRHFKTIIFNYLWA